MKEKIPCDMCDDTGHKFDFDELIFLNEDCPYCDGTGYIQEKTDSHPDILSEYPNPN